MREQLQLWIEAWRGLRDNPLAVYLSQAEARRQQRLGWWRRNRLYVIVLLLLLALGSFSVENYVTSYDDFLWGLLDSPEFILSYLALVVLPLYLLWAGQGLYRGLLDALLVLAPPSRRTHALTIDDLSAITLLTDREIVTGALSVLLPPLLLRLAVGVFLAWQMILAFAYGTQFLDWYILPYGMENDSNFVMALALGPLTMAALFCSGALALMILLLYMLAVGREMNATLASASAAIMVLAQAAYTPVAFGLLLAGLEDIPVDTSQLTCLVEKIVLGAALAWLVAAALRGAELSSRWCYTLAAGTPLLVIALPLLVFLPVGYWTGWESDVMNAMIYPLFAYAVQISAASVLCPLAIPSAQCWGASLDQFYDISFIESWRYPLLLLLQLGLLAVVANYALRAVRLRRRAG